MREHSRGQDNKGDAVSDKRAELGYRPQREHPFWATSGCSRAGDLRIAVTPDLDVIESFLGEPEDFRDQFEQAQRIERNRR